MADNVAITAGSGTSVATDQVGSDHYQKVKLTDGTADSSTMVAVGNGVSANALRVTLTTDGTGVVTLTGDLPDTAAGDLAAIVAALGGNLTVDLGATDNAVLDAIVAALGGTLTVDGSGVTQPVSGTVTATLSATDNAVLDTIETNTDSLTVVGGGAEATALRVTIANDSTGVVSVDDGGGALTVDGTVGVSGTVTVDATGQGDVPVTLDGETVAIASIAAGDNNIGNVDIASALPAGTNAIGKLAANSGVDIGDVDVTSIAAGENLIGLVGASDTVVTITCSLPTGALTAGDVMFDTQEIASAARTSGGTVILQSVEVLDKDDQAADFDLVFLGAATSIGTEDSAVSISDANAEDIVGHVSITSSDYCDLVGCQIATKTGIGLEMQASGSTSLYVAGITRGTPTYTASGVLIKFGFLRS